MNRDPQLGRGGDRGEKVKRVGKSRGVCMEGGGRMSKWVRGWQEGGDGCTERSLGGWG